jgi:hypothetical protein
LGSQRSVIRGASVTVGSEIGRQYFSVPAPDGVLRMQPPHRTTRAALARSGRPLRPDVRIRHHHGDGGRREPPPRRRTRPPSARPIGPPRTSIAPPPPSGPAGPRARPRPP